MHKMGCSAGNASHMSLASEIENMEAALRAAGVTTAALCREARIARSTFDRWKRGETEPNLKTWRGLTVAFDRLITGPREDAA